MAEYRDKLIEEYINAPFAVGEWVMVARGLFSAYTNNPERKVSAKIIEVLPNEQYKVKLNDNDSYGYPKDSMIRVIGKKDIFKDTFKVGHNPFKNLDFWKKFERLEYDLNGILLNCGIYAIDETYRKKTYVIDGVEVPELNYNPYVYDKDGNKLYYQRDYVWTLEDEQLFIESIYNGIECGKIVLREHSWETVESRIKNGETQDIAFKDVIDGKQRLHTLKRFVNDEFKDLSGHYYSDLSEKAKREFENSRCLTYLSLSQNATDEEVIKTFLMVNFAGKPMSQEHLDYVQKINDKISS